MANSLLSVLVVAALAGSAGAQGAPPPARPPQGGGQRGMMGPQNRAQLEQQVRERLGSRLKMELGLNDAQVAKVAETNRKFEEKHHILLDQERDVRMSIRDEMLRGDTTRQAQVASLLDRIIRNERQRVDLMEQEQKDLAAVLSPMQRARYFGIQEAVRKRVQQMRQQKLQGQPPMDDGNGGMQPGPDGAQPGRPMPFRPQGALKKRPLGGVPERS